MVTNNSTKGSSKAIAIHLSGANAAARIATAFILAAVALFLLATHAHAEKGTASDTSSNQNANCSAPTWQNVVNMTVSQNNRRLTKTGGEDGMWDAGASSTDFVQAGGTGSVEASILNSHSGHTPQSMVIGLSNGDPDTAPDHINFGWLIRTDSQQTVATVFEHGVARTEQTGAPSAKLFGGLTSLAPATFKVKVVNNQVRYYVGDVIVYTSMDTPTYPLRVDSAVVRSNTGFQKIKVCSTQTVQAPPATK